MVLQLFLELRFREYASGLVAVTGRDLVDDEYVSMRHELVVGFRRVGPGGSDRLLRNVTLERLALERYLDCEPSTLLPHHLDWRASGKVRDNSLMRMFGILVRL
ncbi:hypothetical protein D7X99_08210 [Corallococcus sp. AB032C]|uniref:hypothetical protein n=1 Tax=Corallococcus TaxID=83461 RepID=UPI000ECC1007|nr:MULTISPECIES: hypothetical protein [Corallococcus]NPC50639.1 hypothetical protein [Corallococcus exiguus]RKH84822.1 hypothetical protein D7X99_08210 [Corallococcus sp. AB032C]